MRALTTPVSKHSTYSSFSSLLLVLPLKSVVFRSSLLLVCKADNEGRIWWQMASVLASIPADIHEDVADQFNAYVLDKDTGANKRTISLFRSP